MHSLEAAIVDKVCTGMEMDVCQTVQFRVHTLLPVNVMNRAPQEHMQLEAIV
jgi:hypothetical protein